MHQEINNRTCSVNHSCGCTMIQVYTQDSFAAALKIDMKDARRVSIHVPYVTPHGAARFADEIAECTAAGSVVDVFLQTPPSWDSRHGEALKPYVAAEFATFQNCIDALTKNGAHVTLRHAIHEKAVVINDNILYLGSLNALSYTGETTEIMFRFEKPWIVELMVKLLNLHSCDECCSHFGHEILLNRPGATTLVPDGDTMSSEYTRLIGAMIRRQRRELGLQIKDLVEATGLSHDAIANAEAGGNVLRSTAERLCQALGMPMHPVPDYLVPLILQFFCKRACSDNPALKEYDLVPPRAISVENAIRVRVKELNLQFHEFLARSDLNRIQLSRTAYLNRTQELCSAVSLVFMPVIALVRGVVDHLLMAAQAPDVRIKRNMKAKKTRKTRKLKAPKQRKLKVRKKRTG